MKFQKLDIALKHYLVGAGFHRALKAYAFAKAYHVGVRKDGITPEFQHQIEIALFLSTLKGLIDEEGCIIVALLHDVMEDYGVAKEEIIGLVGEECWLSAWRMTKVYRGERKDDVLLFEEMASDARASICKGVDRINNYSTMVGVFGAGKQVEYLDEGERLFMPMLKRATFNFPEQFMAYMNVRTVLKIQIAMVRAALAGGCSN